MIAPVEGMAVSGISSTSSLGSEVGMTTDDSFFLTARGRLCRFDGQSLSVTANSNLEASRKAQDMQNWIR